MPSTRTRKTKEASTEEKIKEAARKLFTQKGFAATRTREIAEEAGINLALLNYYFRSKQKLFDLIMEENFRQVGEFGKKINVSVHYLAHLFFHRQRLVRKIGRDPPNELPEMAPARRMFLEQLKDAKNSGKTELDPFQFVANLVGLSVFPFVAKPLLQRVLNVSDEQFHAYMEDRRKLVPMWIGMMMKGKP